MPKRPESLPDGKPAADATVIKRLGPGSPGTRRWLERYGTSLVCVRYRHNEKLQRRYTTVEIIVDERTCQPSNVLIQIAFDDGDLRRQVIQRGGQWLSDRKLWRISIIAVRELGLENQVVENCQ